MSFRTHLLSSTVIPLAVVVGVAAVGVAAGTQLAASPAHAAGNPSAAKKPCAPCSPCAAAKPCAPCSPCAAKKPCAPCAPCGPASVKCVVPRLATAAKKPCAPCAPCAAAQPCAPCAPCAAKKPCAPCAPCAAAKPCAPCAPCAAAQPCAPCAPCGPAAAPELTDAEALAAYECILEDMRAAYAKSGNQVAVSYTSWPRYSTQSYQSATHGGRYVQNYANDEAKAYRKFETVGTLPVGATIAKDSFAVAADGRVAVGPLFMMQKMRAGFSPEGNNWKYTMIMPSGSVFGETGGKNSAGMKFCMECHSTAAETDHLMFMPEEYRAKL
ncbi:MAG: cytochrome P460 family protein [Kiloniellales bacterium]